MTTGIVMGIGLYWFCVAVTGFYTWYANHRIDPLLREMQRATDAEGTRAKVDQSSTAGTTASSSA
jgi:hypothetical protein